MSESSISNEIALALSRESKGKIISWRNNTGYGVLGKVVKQEGEQFHGINGRRVQYGLCVGSSDRIGIVSVTVTPAMVGRTLGIFLALEVKSSTGKATPEQQNFIAAVRKAGGLAGVVRSADEALGICNPLL